MKVVDLRELALKKVKITGNVIGKFGSFEIEQKYQNNTKDVLEVGYTFPIVETATVVGFEIHVGDKVLKGKCKEKSAAKEEYQRNMVQGNSAYLMEQETENIFKISVGKIDKGEEVTVKINYIDKFEIVDNSIQILLPTLVTPKYKSNITDKLFYRKVDYTVDFNINIDKSINRKSIYCPSHAINIIDNEDNETIEVKDYDLSKDFKLIIELKNELSSSAIKSKTLDKQEMIYLSFMPEITDSYEDTEKEYIFIVDISGSMHGEKMDETKKAVIECLKQLDEGDKFNIVPFESNFKAMSIKSIEYNDENLKKAIDYVNSLTPSGGTEILKPIKFALYEKDVNKIVLLFTDGQVGNENEIIDFVETNVLSSRVFPFGIDTNVNSSFIKQLAKVGNGKAELIQPHEKIDEKIIRTFARIQTPLLEDLRIDYGNNKLVDEIKEEKCLFNYEFFNVFAKIEKLTDDITLKGKILDKEYSWKIEKDKIKSTDVDLEVLFAKQQMDRLEEYMRNTHDMEKISNYKKMVIELAEKYNINSKYTSFITIYEREEKLLDVPIYQETALSNAFEDGAIVDAEVCFDRMAMSSDMAMPTGMDSGMGMPGSFMKKAMKTASSSGRIVPNIIKHKDLSELIVDYYQQFISSKEKSLLTYLLFALYYYRAKNIGFSYADFVEFIQNYQQEILGNDHYSTIIVLLNKYQDNNRQELLDLVGEDYKKVALTGMQLNPGFKSLSQDEVEKIQRKKITSDNVDQVLEHLLSKYMW
jgi:Ca-activated chloride channel family protein